MMDDLHKLPNSEIDRIIKGTYKTKKNQDILHDRIIGGLTYRELALKYYPESDWWGRSDHDLFRHKVQSMVNKIQKAALSL